MSFLLPPLPPKFEAALRDVHGKRPESRVAAAERLGRADEGERARALTALCTLTRDTHPAVRATAVTALGLLSAHEVLDVVLEALRDVSPDVRELAVIAATQIGGDHALRTLRSALTAEAPEVRFQAISAVLELAPDDAAHDLVPLIRDRDPAVRAQALASLAALRAPHLAGYFGHALEDPDRNVRLEAALALAACGDPRAEPPLLRMISERLAPRERVPDVANALASLASQAAREPLAHVAANLFTSPFVRAAVGAALVRLGDPRGEQALRRVLRGFRADARGYAVDLVRETAASALIPELTRLAVRPRGADLLAIVDALARFAAHDATAHRALTELSTRSDEVGERARAALPRP